MKRKNEKKNKFIQLRIDSKTKKRFLEIAKMQHLTLSEWMVNTLNIWGVKLKILEIYKLLEEERDKSYSLALLGDLFNKIPNCLWDSFVSYKPDSLNNETTNYIASMIDEISANRHLARPAWIHNLEPLSVPYFGSNLTSLRMYLLIKSKVVFRKNNIFVDSSAGDRV